MKIQEELSCLTKSFDCDGPVEEKLADMWRLAFHIFKCMSKNLPIPPRIVDILNNTIGGRWWFNSTYVTLVTDIFPVDVERPGIRRYRRSCPIRRVSYRNVKGKCLTDKRKGQDPKILLTARTTQNSLRATTAVTQSSYFLTLPRELRDEIYTHILPFHKTLKLDAPTWNEASPPFGNAQTSPYSLEILAVCQKIHAEATPILYSTNHFVFSMGIRRAWGAGPYNTVGAVPRSGIMQIKECTVRICVGIRAHTQHDTAIINGWLDELCTLLKQGGHLREIRVELDHPFDHLLKDGPTLLRPFHSLSQLKSASVDGHVTETYAGELKAVMEKVAISIECTRRSNWLGLRPDDVAR